MYRWKRKEEVLMEPKKVSDSITEQLRVVIYPDINGFGRLFGGRLLEWIDEVAGATARRHCGRDATTVATMRQPLPSIICNSKRAYS